VRPGQISYALAMGKVKKEYLRRDSSNSYTVVKLIDLSRDHTKDIMITIVIGKIPKNVIRVSDGIPLVIAPSLPTWT